MSKKYTDNKLNPRQYKEKKSEKKRSLVARQRGLKVKTFRGKKKLDI